MARGECETPPNQSPQKVQTPNNKKPLYLWTKIGLANISTTNQLGDKIPSCFFPKLAKKLLNKGLFDLGPNLARTI
jgi:hypothetical protein